jgi:hypothetical protein
VLRDILCFGVAETPNLIALNLRAWQIAHDVVGETLASLANLYGQTAYGFLCDAGHANCCALRIALYETGNDARSFLCG